ncbi:MAG: Peptidase domain protein [Verrucomicrobiales bacterium]|nr:Peptidase domain protein [Verrucomicrobiales bacterium]
MLLKFDNGLRFACVEMPHMASVSVGIWVGTGGRYEPLKLNGVSHFIEHLLFKGTRKRNAKEISQAVEGVGGYLNAFTSEEHTCFYARAGVTQYETILEVLMDMFLNSKFDPVELERERGVIKEELAMYLDQPSQLVHEILNETLWPNHPLGRSITGTMKSLDAIQRSDLLEYFRQFYNTGSTLVVVAGPIKSSKALASFKKFYKKVRPGKTLAYSPITVDQTEPRVRLLTKKTEQTQLAMGIRTCSRHQDDRFSLRILNAVFGENMSSRIFQTIREEHGLAYTIYSSTSFFQDTGTITVSAGLDSGNLSKAMELVIREMQILKQTSVSRKELTQGRDYVLGQLDLHLESTENRMMWIGEQLLGYGKMIPIDLIKKQISQVTARDIRRAANTYFRPEHLSVALVSPIKKAPVFPFKLLN